MVSITQKAGCICICHEASVVLYTEIDGAAQSKIGVGSMLFSVIVPIYKIEKYLCRCIDSVLSQSFGDYELILVDDGSPDNCPTICDEYAKKDGIIY